MSALLAPPRRVRVSLLVLVLVGTLPCALLIVGAGLERRSADGTHAQEAARRPAALASLELD